MALSRTYELSQTRDQSQDDHRRLRFLLQKTFAGVTGCRAESRSQSHRACGLGMSQHDCTETTKRQSIAKQWAKGGQKTDKLELDNILKLIQKAGKFNNTNEDSQFNLDRMVQMQDDTAAQDECHGKIHHYMYGGVLGPVWKDPEGPEEFNESLLCIRQAELYDSDNYLETFQASFKISYLLRNFGPILGELGHKVSRERLQWLMQLRERLGCRVQE